MTDHPSWQGSWCWSSRSEPIVQNVFVYFRREFRLAALPAQPTVIRISADARYTLWINGQWVHQGPARSVLPHQSYDQIDIAPYLKIGSNVIGVIGHQYGVVTFFTQYRGVSGLLIDGSIVTPAETLSLATPDGWLCSDSVAWRPNVVRRSIQLGFQEHIDYRLEPPHWLDETFTPDASWHAPVVVARAGLYPWIYLEPRGVPLLAHHAESFSRIAAVFTGRADPHDADIDDVYHLPQRESHAPRPELADTFAGLVAGSSAVIPATGEDEYFALVLDPEVYRSGMFWMDVQDAAGGEIIDVIYAQGLSENHFPVLLGSMGGKEGCRESPADRFICRPGDQHCETFDYNGMRYVMLIFRHLRRPLKVCACGIRVIHADVPQSGSFNCSDATLNTIWQAGKQTQINCLFDAFEDCPWREQAMWWGDARIQAGVTRYAFGDSSILARGIRLMAQAQAADGALHAHPPADFPFHYLPDFMMTWVNSLQDYYWQTADTELIRECIPTLHRLMDFFQRHVTDDGFIGDFDGYWVFLDWAPLFKNNYSALLNMLYLEALRNAASLCQLAQDPKAETYQRASLTLTQSIERLFFDPTSGRWFDGFDAAAGTPVKTFSQQTHALAILLDLKPETHQRLAREVLLSAVRQPESGIIEATPFFYAYVLEALGHAGLTQEAVDTIGRKWGQILPPHVPGVTTYPSQWPKPGQSVSGCHAWSASPVYHLIRLILGIAPVEPGWRTIRIAPRLGTLSFASVTIPTQSGCISVTARRNQAGIRTEIILPEGVRADVGDPSGTLSGGTHTIDFKE